MEEENKKQNEEKEETKTDEEKIAGETKIGEKKTEKEAKKKTREKKPKRDEAIVNAKDVPISTKHSIAICNFIRGKGIEEANFMLQEVVKMKKALPMKGEIPHRKGKIMSGRYPINAAKQFIKLLKQLNANANVNGLEIEKGKIECKANRASRPYRRSGSERFKRTHVTLRLKEKAEKTKKQGENKEKKN